LFGIGAFNFYFNRISTTNIEQNFHQMTIQPWLPATPNTNHKNICMQLDPLNSAETAAYNPNNIILQLGRLLKPAAQTWQLCSEAVSFQSFGA